MRLITTKFIRKWSKSLRKWRARWEPLILRDFLTDKSLSSRVLNSTKMNKKRPLKKGLVTPLHLLPTKSSRSGVSGESKLTRRLSSIWKSSESEFRAMKGSTWESRSEILSLISWCCLMKQCFKPHNSTAISRNLTRRKMARRRIKTNPRSKRLMNWKQEIMCLGLRFQKIRTPRRKRKSKWTKVRETRRDSTIESL